MPGVTITIDAETKVAAQNLEQFFKQTLAGFESLSSQNSGNAFERLTYGAGHSAEALKKLRESSLLAREGMHQLQSAVLLLGGERFTHLTEGVIAARAAMGVTRTTALLTGASLGTVSLAVAGVAAAIAIVGIPALNAYKAKIQETKTAAELLAQTQELIARNVKTVNDALEKKVINKADADFILELLNLKSPEGLAQAAREMRKLGISTEQIEATEKFTKLIREAQMAALGEGTEAEFKRAKEKLDSRLQEIQNLVAKNPLLKAQQPQAEGAARAEFDTRVAELNATNKKEAEARVIQKIDEEITNYQIANTEKLTGKAEDEFGIRARAYFTLRAQQVISDERYNELYSQAELKRLQGLKEEEQQIEINARKEQEAAKKRLEDAIKDQQVRFQNSIGSIDLRVRAIQTNPNLSDREKDDRELPLLQLKLAQINQRIASEQLLGLGQKINGESTVETETKILDLDNQRLEVQRQLQSLDSQTFFGSMSEGISQLDAQWGNLGRNFADVAINGMRAAVQGITDAIMGAIEGTVTWGQVFAQVGRSIIASLIQMLVQWVVNMTIMKVLKTIFHQEDQQAAQQSAQAWAPAATAASIASYGAAAAIGTAATIAGIISATGVASALSASAREHGGPVTRGQSYIVGEKRPEFFVPSESGFILPSVPNVMSLSKSGATETKSPTANVRVIVVADMRGAAEEAMKSSTGEQIIIQTVDGRRLDLGHGT